MSSEFPRLPKSLTEKLKELFLMVKLKTIALLPILLPLWLVLHLVLFLKKVISFHSQREHLLSLSKRALIVSHQSNIRVTNKRLAKKLKASNLANSSTTFLKTFKKGLLLYQKEFLKSVDSLGKLLYQPKASSRQLSVIRIKKNQKPSKTSHKLEKRKTKPFWHTWFSKKKKTKKVEEIRVTKSKSFRQAFFLRRLHRGRPRKRPLLTIWNEKFTRWSRRVFPTPYRIAFVGLILVLATFFYSLFLITIARSIPSPQKLTDTGSPITTEFYDRNGKLLYRLYEGKNRTLVNIDDLPPQLIQATIAIEDKSFYSHPGVDVLGIARAVNTYLTTGQVTGGSTITQQLIKNTLLTPERTFERKTKEIALAYWVETIFTKKDILQMYFNEVPYGGPAWGIAAASQTYFDKEPKELTLGEIAYLTGLPASPTTFSPYGSHPELAKERQKEVLRRMVEDGYITQEEADIAYEEKLDIKPPIQTIKAPHFVMYVREQLAKKYGEKMISQGGLKVITSLDLNVQEMAENVVSEEVSKLSSLDVGNGAAMVTDPKTGEILAMVGSKNYWDNNGGNFNVTIAARQPGSSIKPITFATAFKQGYTPGTIILDNPVVFRNEWEAYAPVNYDGKFHGPVTLRTALGSSYNIPAVKLLALTGIPSMIQTATDMGITTFNDQDRYGLSLTLGGGETKMIDMMTVYGTFAQNGVRHDPQAVLKVTTSTGLILEDNSEGSKGKKVLPSSIAYMITDILTDNKARTPAFGPDSLLNIKGHTAAVKTGTTDNKRDNWTFGYTPNYVVGVWVGNNNNRPMNPSLTSGVTGAAPIWNKILTNLVRNEPNLAFERPSDIADGTVDNNKDLTVPGQTPKSVTAQGKKRQKDEKTKEEKDVITFTDPFSTYVPTEPVIQQR